MRAQFARPLCALALLLACAAMPAAAQDKAKPPQEQEPDLINPDRPGIADGSAVIGPKRFQVEIGVQKEFRSDATSTMHTLFVPTLLRIGVNDKWEGRIETTGYTWNQTRDMLAGRSVTDGYAPISLGTKYHWQDGKGPHKPSLGAILRLFVPSGSSDFGSHRFQGDLRFAADWDLTKSGDFSLNPNVGLGLYDNGNDGVFAAGLFAVTLNYFDKTKTINPFVDMGLQGPEVEHRRTVVVIDTGIAYIVRPDVQLDASIGTGILGRTPPHPFWSVGISLRR